MLIARVIILLVLTGLQVFFCYKAGAWVSIPNEMWIIGLLCGGEKAIKLISDIRISGDKKDANLS